MPSISSRIHVQMILWQGDLPLYSELNSGSPIPIFWLVVSESARVSSYTILYSLDFGREPAATATDNSASDKSLSLVSVLRCARWLSVCYAYAQLHAYPTQLPSRTHSSLFIMVGPVSKLAPHGVQPQHAPRTYRGAHVHRYSTSTP